MQKTAELPQKGASQPEIPLQKPVIIWFRDDLRVSDNPALSAAVATGKPVLCLYILDEISAGMRTHGGASRWWLHGALEALSQQLKLRGSELVILLGASQPLLQQLIDQTGASGVFWNRRYGKAERALDSTIKTDLQAIGIEAKSFNGHLLREPWEVATQSGTPMKVFTPYWRAARAKGEPSLPLKAPESISGFDVSSISHPARTDLASLKLKPVKPDWSKEITSLWQPGEDSAKANLATFLAGPVKGYGENRNRPDMASTSRLSPHLRFGEISPRQIWHATKHAAESGETPGGQEDIDKFLSEVGWREFAFHLLYHYPDLRTVNFQSRFDSFPWDDNPKGLLAWQKGMTGYPIVDAGMRELWRTGWMHNRVRMVVGSFLVKHLLIDWRKGEEWFWDTLVDADPANNTASWQWIAGSGADASPYFRIFAPVLQGEKFDPKGEYVRKYVPELARLPNAFLQKPWMAPPEILRACGVKLGETYPKPIVIHEDARKKALAAFKSMSDSAPEAAA
ncbi:MAG: cryptochrome/photolyase family protein [Beijerinckiaceae bacterium]